MTPRLCPYCGGPHEPGQEYCLECGSRLPRSGSLLRALGEAWQRMLPWYPGDWIWPSLAALVIAGSGAAAAIAATGGGRGGPETIVATAPFTTLPPPAPAVASPPKAPAIAAPRRVKPRRRPGLIAWPGANGYTVVLSSLPASGGLAAAQAQADEALAAGAPQVGVLRSDGFSSLHPGYYIIFSGVYVSMDDALTAVATLHGKFPEAYARPIAR